MQRKKSRLLRLRQFITNAYVFTIWTLRMAVILAPALGGFYLIWKSYFPPDGSEFVKRLKQLDNYDFDYANKLIEGDWDVICQLRSCKEIMSPYFAEKYSNLNSKIPALEVCSETSWEIVFSNHECVSYITTNQRTSLASQYVDFTEATLKKFAGVGFKPQECAEFKYAIFFKYAGKSWHSGHVRTLIALGELDR